MNAPYVKKFKKNPETGEMELQNPIPPSGFHSFYPNRRARRGKLPKRTNCRKGRNYYQPKLMPILDLAAEERGERVILTSVPTGGSIPHRKDHGVSYW